MLLYRSPNTRRGKELICSNAAATQKNKKTRENESGKGREQGWNKYGTYIDNMFTSKSSCHSQQEEKKNEKKIIISLCINNLFGALDYSLKISLCINNLFGALDYSLKISLCINNLFGTLDYSLKIRSFCQ